MAAKTAPRCLVLAFAAAQTQYHPGKAGFSCFEAAHFFSDTPLGREQAANLFGSKTSDLDVTVHLPHEGTTPLGLVLPLPSWLKTPPFPCGPHSSCNALMLSPAVHGVLRS